MSQSLRAQFELDFAVGSTDALNRVTEVLEKIDATLERLRRVADPFDGLTQPVARATSATRGLNETLERTTAVTETVAAATGTAREEITGMGSAAAEAAEGLTTMGQRAEAAAEQTVGAMNRVREASGAPAGGGSSGGGGGSMGRLRGLGGAVGGFGSSIEAGVGHAFGAAATGFGLIEPIHAAAEYDNDLTHIGIGLGLHGQANVDYGRAFGERLDALARATGTRGSDLAAAAGFFSREGYTGDRLDAVLPTVAHIATAYNAAPDAVAKSTFALQESMKIGDGQLGGALASLALAGKSADLPFEQLAPLLPQVAAQAGALGVSGRSGVDDLAAALAVVRKSTGTEGEAVTDTRQFLTDIINPHVAARFKKFGVDLYAIKDHAKAAGEDPMMAVLAQVDRLTRHGQDSRVLGTLFGNQQSQGFVQAILQHWDQYQQIHERTSGANQSVINEDFDTGLQSTLVRLQSFEEALAQLQRRIGTSFVPTLNVLTGMLHGLTSAFDFANRVTGGWATTITGGVGAFLAFATVLGVLRAVMGPLSSGLSLLFGRVGLLRGAIAALRWVFVGLAALVGPEVAAVIAAVAVLGGAAYLLIKHWEPVKAWFAGLWTAMTGWAHSIGDVFSHIFDGFTSAFSTMESRIANSSIGRMLGLGSAQPVPAMPGGGGAFSLHVSHDPGLRVSQTGGTPGAVSVSPDRGRMVSRP